MKEAKEVYGGGLDEHRHSHFGAPTDCWLMPWRIGAQHQSEQLLTPK